MSKGLSDGQTKPLRVMNIEEEADIATFAAVSNMAWTEERETDGKNSRMALRQIGESDQEMGSHV